MDSKLYVETRLEKIAKEHQINDICEPQLAEILSDMDPLKFLRREFFYPKMKTLATVDPTLVDSDQDSIYLNGNSLGLQAKRVKHFIDIQLDKWAKMGSLGHREEPLPWQNCDEYIVDGFAKIVGAKNGECVLMNGLTVNIHIMLVTRYKILLESKAFPSDHYAIESQIRLKGYKVEDAMVCLEPREDEFCLRTEDIVSYLQKEGSSVALVFFSGIQYYTGQLFEIAKITKAAQEKGCTVGWDLAHAIGNVPLYLHDWNVDFACWNLYTELDLEDGAFGYRISNPPPLLVCPLQAILEIYAKTSMEALREKSLLLTGYFEILIRKKFGKEMKNRKDDINCTIITPKDPNARGCQLSLIFSIDIHQIYDQLAKRGVVCDKRYPNVIRVSPVHLYNNFTDVHRFISALDEVLTFLKKNSNNNNYTDIKTY